MTFLAHLEPITNVLAKFHEASGIFNIDEDRTESEG